MKSFIRHIAALPGGLLFAGACADQPIIAPQVPAGPALATALTEAYESTLGGHPSVPVQLPSKRNTTSRAYGINAQGWIAGPVKDIRHGGRAAVLWRPQQDSGGEIYVPKGNANNCK